MASVRRGQRLNAVIVGEDIAQHMQDVLYNKKLMKYKSKNSAKFNICRSYP